MMSVAMIIEATKVVDISEAVMDATLTQELAINLVEAMIEVVALGETMTTVLEATNARYSSCQGKNSHTR